MAQIVECVIFHGTEGSGRMKLTDWSESDGDAGRGDESRYEGSFLKRTHGG